MSLFAAVRAAAGDGARPALVAQRRTWTYAQLLGHAERLADHLGRHRAPGPDLIAAHVAGPAARAVVSLACDLAGLPVLHGDPAAAPSHPGVVVRDDSSSGTAWDPDGELPLWFERAPERPVPPGIADGAQIFLTSGSTGTPTGVVRPASVVLADCRRIGAFMRYGTGVPVSVSTPVFHPYGFTYGLLAPLLHGAVARFTPPRSTLSSLVRAVREHDADSLVTLPFHCGLLATSARTPELPRLRRAVSSGAPLPTDTARALAERFDFALHNGYGSSETGAISLVRVGPDFSEGDVGTLLPGLDARAVPVEGVDFGGELLLLTDSLAVGYLGQDGVVPLEQTQGWYRTGDLAFVEDRRIRLTGRLRNLINVAGKKVSPLEIERVVAAHPAVSEVQVLAVADASRGQVPMARVVAAGAVTEEDIVAWCRSRLTSHQLPRRVEFVAELARSATGKVLKGV
ncbi:class I adenylate-forming enzyme family protein [Streptomyces sp. NPDC002577]